MSVWEVYASKVALHNRLELELELIQSHMAQKPMLRGEVGWGARVLRDLVGNGNFKILILHHHIERAL